MSIRQIQPQDYYNDHLQFLYPEQSNITITFSEYHQQLMNMATSNIYMYILTDKKTHKIIGNISLLVEYSLTNNLNKIGHIKHIKANTEANYIKLLDYAILQATNMKCNQILIFCDKSQNILGYLTDQGYNNYQTYLIKNI